MTYLEIVQKACNRLGLDEPTTLVAATDEDIIVLSQFVNRVYHTMELMREWWWLETRARVRMFPSYTTGTIVTTDGSDQLTGTGTLWVTAAVAAGDWFQRQGDTAYYEVSSVDAEGTITLTSNFIGTNTASSYTIVRPAYDLPSGYSRMKYIVDLKNQREIDPVSPDDFLNIRSGRTTSIPFRYARMMMQTGTDIFYYTLYGLDASQNRQLYIYPYPTSERDLEVWYTTAITELSADADTPLVPVKYQEGMIDAIMGMWYQHKGDDTRFSVTKQDAAAWVEQMLQEQDAHDSHDFQVKVSQSAKAREMAGMLWRGNQATLTQRSLI